MNDVLTVLSVWIHFREDLNLGLGAVLGAQSC